MSMNYNKQKHWPLSLLFTTLISASALASDSYTSNYQSWNNQTDTSRELIQELRKLVDKADDARAADPKFIGDLRKLASRYDLPRLRSLFEDDFRDDNFTHNPSWHVVGGKFWVERHNGLRSQVEQYQSNPRDDEPAPADIGDIFIGALLKELDKNKDKKKENHQQFQYQPATIRLDKRIPNSFVMRAELVSSQRQGSVDFVLYQDSRKLSGYRLRYTPGSNQPFQFLRVSERGESVIEAYRKPVNLEDNRVHSLEWQREQNGKMTLKLDSNTLFSTTDSWLREDFLGVALINNGGDYSLRRISLSELY